jgi:hypothetical protein
MKKRQKREERQRAKEARKLEYESNMIEITKSEFKSFQEWRKQNQMHKVNREQYAAFVASKEQ